MMTTTGGSIKVEQYKRYGVDVSLMKQDYYHMSTPIGKNVEMLHAKHPDEQCSYVIIVNTKTGESILIDFEE